LVSLRKFSVRNLEHRAIYKTVVSPIELHDGMMGLAARSHELQMLEMLQDSMTVRDMAEAGNKDRHP
jgi:hypothetical protein